MSRATIGERLRIRPAMAIAALLPLVSGGCALFHRSQPQPPTVILNQPIILTPPVVTNPTPAPVPPPPLQPATATRVKSRPPHHRGRPRWRRRPPVRRPLPPPRPTPAPAAVATAPLPLFTPGLNLAQQQQYRNQTLSWLQQAQRELTILNTRRLSAEQVGTRTQAWEFVHQAQEALDQTDLIRAQNLARKALALAGYLLRQTE